MRKREGVPLSRLSCFAIVEDEEKAWFVRAQANGLYEFDKKAKRAKLLMRFSGYPIDKRYLCMAIEKVGSTLVIALAAAAKIVLYDLTAGKAEYLELVAVEDNRKVKYTGEAKFVKCYRYQDSVYLFGFEYPAVLKVDVNTKQIVYLTDWVNAVEQRIEKMPAAMGYVTDCVVAGDYIWALCECADVVLRLDLRTDEIRIVDICSDLDIRCGIYFDGNFWVTGYNENANRLLKYDSSFVLEKNIEVYAVPKDGGQRLLSLQDNLCVSYPILDLEDRLLLCSAYPGHAYEFDKNSQNVEIFPAFEELLKIREEKFQSMGVLAPRKRGNLVCFISGNDFLWNEYDFVHGTLKRYEVRAEDDEEFLEKRLKFMTERVLTENEIPWNLGYKLPLSRYLEHVVCLTNAKTGNKKKENSECVKNDEKNNREVSAV